MSDLREVFESSFGPEPPLRPIDTAVDAGRAALRRRNALLGGAGLVAASVVLLGATQLGSEPTAAPPVVGEPTPSATPTISDQQRLTDATRVDESWRTGCGQPGQMTCEVYAEDRSPVWLDGTELVRVSRDVQILDVVVDRAPPRTRTTVVEAITPPDIHPQWWILTRTASGVRARTTAGRSFIDFATFARAVITDREVEGAPPLTAVKGVFD